MTQHSENYFSYIPESRLCHTLVAQLRPRTERRMDRTLDRMQRHSL